MRISTKYFNIHHDGEVYERYNKKDQQAIALKEVLRVKKDQNADKIHLPLLSASAYSKLLSEDIYHFSLEFLEFLVIILSSPMLPDCTLFHILLNCWIYSRCHHNFQRHVSTTCFQFERNFQVVCLQF